MIVGTEWLVEASGCDASRLRDVRAVRAVLERAVAELNLCVVGEIHEHKFPGAGGVTCAVVLTESHLACHTYPEFRIATFNLYCCRARPRWAWEERLAEMLGAREVTVKEIVRRARVDVNEGERVDEDARDVNDGFAAIIEEEKFAAGVEVSVEAGGRGR